MVRSTLIGISIAAISIAAAGPVNAKRAPKPPEPPLDLAAFEWSRATGSNSISGEALLRTQGGDVKTCAGLPVQLIPVTPYTDAYAIRTFGSTSGGLRLPVPLLLRGPPPLRPEVAPYIRTTTCNSMGRFNFRALPDGAFYVVPTVTWSAPSQYGPIAQGGEILRRVDLAGGVEQEIIVTQ